MPKQKAYALGIDLGGTKTLAAIVDVTSGEVVGSARKRTRAERGQDFVSGRITELATVALDAAKLPDPLLPRPATFSLSPGGANPLVSSREPECRLSQPLPRVGGGGGKAAACH